MPERPTRTTTDRPARLDRAPALGEVVRVRLRVPDSFGPLRWVGTRSNPNREPRFDEAALRRVEMASRRLAVVGGRRRGREPRARLPLAARRRRRPPALAEPGRAVERRGARSRRLPLVAHAAGAEWAASSVLYQVFPTGSRVGRRRRPPDARLGDPAPSGPTRSTSCRRPGSAQFFGGDLDGCASTSTTSNRSASTCSTSRRSSRRGRTTATTRRPSTTSTRCSAATTRWSGSSRRRTHGASVSSETSRRITRATRTSGSARRRRTRLRPSASSTLPARRRQLRVVARACRACRSSTGSRPSCAAASSRAPTRSSARFLAPPFNLDGWRIDVANMTGRLGDEDLNESVRRTIRATMLEVNPDTLLLGESTNDAASDFQGDAWHGAMTYTPFTRPLWSWLQQPGSPAGGGIGFALAQVPTFTGERVRRRAPAVRRRIPVAHAPRDHERARHARHPAVPDAAHAPARCRSRSVSRSRCRASRSSGRATSSG